MHPAGRFYTRDNRSYTDNSKFLAAIGFGMEKTPIALEREKWDVMIHVLEEMMAELAPQGEWLGEYPGEGDAVAIEAVHEEMMESLADDSDGYDLLIEGMNPAEFVAILGGVGSFAADALRKKDAENVHAAGRASDMLLRANPALTRDVLLSEEHGQFLDMVGELPDDLGEELEIEWVDGEWRDTRGMTNIEIEGGDDGQ